MITVSLVASFQLKTIESQPKDAKRLAEIHDHNELMAKGEPVSDVIAPRLSGTAAQRTAGAWAE